MTGLLYDLPAAGVAALLGTLLAAVFWLVWRALPHYRSLSALRTAPVVTIASGASGVVRIEGVAHPAEVPEGYAVPKFCWEEESRFDGRTGRSSGTRSVARILVRDETGESLLLAEEATVVPGGRNHDVDQMIFSGDVSTTTRFIRTGDTVLAIGILGGDKALPGQKGARRRLRRSPQGVLVLSGVDEQRTARYLAIRLIPRVAMALACLGLAGWTWWVRPLF